MFIVNQDRDTIIKLQKKENLNIQLNTYKYSIIGYSLYYEDIQLGTFDSLYEVILEFYNIINSKYNVYVIGGFVDYENCFKEVI